MKRNSLAVNILSSLILLILFLTAPLAGVILRGQSPDSYLQFPPVTTMVEQSSFSPIAFTGVLLFVFVATFPFWRRLGGSLSLLSSASSHPQRRFPWWGWIAMTGVVVFWVLAWNRFTWFENLQRHTFFPLWFCFIVFLNATMIRISGKCLMTNRPLYFALLFPASAVFWWAFEYLNRFVNNWHYLGMSEIGGWQYFGEASLAFSTVLPAVLSVRYILLQTKVFAKSFNDFPEFPWITSNILWSTVGVASILALVLVGWLPELMYPLIWILPGLLWITRQRWAGYINPLLKEVSAGSFRLVWTSACAALLCGFFWEMWNMYSEAKWVYSIPGLDRFHIFEMPLLGYAGYLPFGVICAIVANSLLGLLTQKE